MSNSVLFWLAVAVLLFWAVGAYNRLVRLRSRGLAAFADLAKVFNQYIVMIKTSFPVAEGFPVMVGVQPTDRASASAWAAIAAAADQLKASLRMATLKPLDGPTVSALRTAFETLCLTWLRLQNLPPDLAGATLPDTLQTQWQQLSVQTELARHDFNTTVLNYNQAIEQFPALLLAALFAFRPAQPI